MARKNIMMDMAFRVETDLEFEDLPQIVVLQAILERVVQLMKCWEPEAIGFCDECDLEG